MYYMNAISHVCMLVERCAGIKKQRWTVCVCVWAIISTSTNNVTFGEPTRGLSSEFRYTCTCISFFTYFVSSRAYVADDCIYKQPDVHVHKHTHACARARAHTHTHTHTHKKARERLRQAVVIYWLFVVHIQKVWPTEAYGIGWHREQEQSQLFYK